MNDLCNATLGRGLDVGNRVVATLRKKATKRFDSTMTLDGGSRLSAEFISPLVAELRATGFAKIPQFVQRELAETLRERIEALEGIEPGGATYSSMEDWMNRGSMPRLNVNRAGLLAVTELSAVDLTPLSIVARQMLGAAPDLLGPHSWITRPLPDMTEVQKEDSAMAYHCDSDFFGFMKVFLLLTEVQQENGPFTFLSGSHRGKRHVQGRVTDATLRVEPRELCFGTGSPGDVVLAMTTGWHKATPPTAGHRTMVQWLFSNGLFGSATQ
ncbi:MAG: phytanoyl-CoA dioxygenase family protein [Actinomycetia bacterium]|nr:phytanoyl-CoA dioxygenase family protein [Actinomycetes bacterium]